MPRVSVTTQKITHAGLVQALTAPTSAGDIVDTGWKALVVNNASGASITVTVETPVVVDSLPLTALTVTVAAGTTEYIGPLSASTFGQLAGSVDVGRAYVDYSSVTSVTRAVVSF